MKTRHIFAALLLACGLAQHAFGQEPKLSETQQEAQQAPAMQDAMQHDGAEEKAAPAAAPSVPAAVQPEKQSVPEAPAALVPRADSSLLDVKITDVLIALFTGLLVLLGWTLARRTGEATAAARDSAAVAEKSARAAEEALVAGQRAFMFIREIKTILHQDPETGKYHWTIHPVWANSGNTPTRGLSIHTSYRLLDAPLTKDDGFHDSHGERMPTVAGPRSMVEASPGTISSDDLEAVQNGTKFFYIWGWAEYHDIFEGTKKRLTRFCNQLVQVDGDPAAPANEHNPVQMMFAFHAENNYAD
ncbi:MAG TPA: hypothetical protein VEC01_16715 [Noviherbaspirillum sp.]|uniref:hypothetical protein n=1 Tax=Noviherbaspirillum sp. TaxID=1926288 RepID=UPI002D496FE8|nr:hypothetical protein [Noviherbaspirillum sp.]HYD96973.1 hypothetical protein [Noviherbaspirillum sp.]